MRNGISQVLLYPLRFEPIYQSEFSTSGLLTHGQNSSV
jgi:hypothetical protein